MGRTDANRHRSENAANHGYVPFPRNFRNAGTWAQAVLGLGAQGVQGTILTSRHGVADPPGSRHAHRTFRVGIFAHFNTS